MDKNGKVFSIVDNKIANHDPHYACDFALKMWKRIKAEIPGLIYKDSQGIVWTLEEKPVCRPYKFTTSTLFHSGEYRDQLRFYIDNIRMCIGEIIEKERVDVFIALGGARPFADKLLENLQHHKIYVDRGVILMRKELKDGRVVDVHLDENHCIPNFTLEGKNVFIIEDFANTCTQAMMAVKKAQQGKANVVGVLSFTNSFGDYWPFGVDHNITFVNLDYTKYPKDKLCPIFIQQTRLLMVDYFTALS